MIAPNSALLPGSQDLLDAHGHKLAALVVPPGAFSGLAGLTLHHAWIALDLGSGAVTLASNALPLALVP